MGAGPDARGGLTLRGALAALVIGIATTLVILAIAILPFLSPPWVAFAQTRAQAEAWTGFTTPELRTVTDGILEDLVIGPPDFDVALDGKPVLEDRERQHMRDVRGVFAAFYAAALAGAVVLVGAFVVARGPEARIRLWRRLAGSGIAIAVVTIVGGVVGLLFFDQAFELFHELFFPPGSYLFDPATERLVQLFPQQFWIESTIGVGALVVVLALALAWYARRRAAALSARLATSSTPRAIASIDPARMR